MAVKVVCNYSQCGKVLNDEPMRLALVVQNPSAVDPVIPANDPDAGQLDFCSADHAAKFFAAVHKALPKARKEAGARTLRDTEEGVRATEEFRQAQAVDPEQLSHPAAQAQARAPASPRGRTAAEDEHFKVGPHRST